MDRYLELYALTKGLSVLFIEDYKPFAKEIEKTLQDLFSHVEVVEDGEQGLELFLAYKKEHNRFFDIVITDIRLPKMDGVTLSKKIVSENKNQNIIVISSYSEAEDLIELLNIGVKRFIKKPIDYDDFCDALYSASLDMQNSSESSIMPNEHVALGFNYLWNREEKTLYSGEEKIFCTNHELMLIDFLASNKSRVCSADMIIEYFEQKSIEISPKTIRNVVSNIRKKTYSDAIQNIYGLGYCLYGK